jgi:hypothetical protein
VTEAASRGGLGTKRHRLGIVRSLEVGMFLAAAPKFERCDVVICPKSLSQYGTFDTKHLEEIEAIGYAAAVERMASIVAAVAAPREACSPA